MRRPSSRLARAHHSSPIPDVNVFDGTSEGSPRAAPSPRRPAPVPGVLRLPHAGAGDESLLELRFSVCLATPCTTGPQAEAVPRSDPAPCSRQGGPDWFR
jgi:hypothetical protein